MSKRVSHSSFKRVLLKISGESLVGKQSFGIDQQACFRLASAIKGLKEEGLEVAIVIGGGNIFRGVTLKGVARTPADQMGMLATLMNGIALQQALNEIECPVQLMTALECPRIAEAYHWAKAIEALKTGQVLLFVGGTGNPYFTTDTAAALRASEIQADLLLKATKVDGIYSKDPLKHPDAVKYEEITYAQMLAEKLEVMDATAAALCMSNRLPMFVFNMRLLGKEPILQIIAQGHGTFVH